MCENVLLREKQYYRLIIASKNGVKIQISSKIH